ncbi:cobalamin-binding protein [Shewanella sp. NIFS-20-20]|uniref:cobalamin-binding protein n=1 Tax=Shewanella sp. NIFS-20-20 TaxID=2853806 RepID=UPI001C476769|nr:cobalamin-binding protein [Shewanella sp. NIFS-20-20]MBV7314742.1 cobalamin-binding protein [Shewanella sp. NIFS-20-20]
MKALVLCGLLLLAVANDALAATPTEPAMRIVALSPHSVELLFAIGAGSKIVAATDHADYPEAAKKIPSIGGYYGISIEKIISLKPDLVVFWQSGNRPEDIQRLKSLGIALVNSDPKTLADIGATLIKLGQLTGLEANAQQAASHYQAQLDQLQRHYQQSALVSVFYQLWPKPLMTVANGSWIEQILTVCHGDNIFAGSATEYPQVSVEQVIMAAPEVILQSGNQGNVAGIDWQQWPSIPAVKRQHIIQLDADLLHRPTPRVLQGITQVCQALDQARK